MADDDQKHEEAESTQMQDEQDPEGSMPATGSDETEEPTLDEAHEMGLYRDATDDGDGQVVEVGIADQLNRNEIEHQKDD